MLFNLKFLHCSDSNSNELIITVLPTTGVYRITSFGESDRKMNGRINILKVSVVIFRQNKIGKVETFLFARFSSLCKCRATVSQINYRSDKI